MNRRKIGSVVQQAEYPVERQPDDKTRLSMGSGCCIFGLLLAFWKMG